MGVALAFQKVTWPAIQSGRYYSSAAYLNFTTGSDATGVVTYMPFYSWVNKSYDQMAIQLTTNGAATSFVRFGIWQDDGNGKPGTLLYDSGQVGATTGAGALKTAAISPAIILSHDTLYWLGVGSQGTNGNFATWICTGGANGMLYAFMPLSYAVTLSGTILQRGWRSSGIAGAFGSNPVVIEGVNPRVPFLRAA